jgi:hypothetical protein
MPPLWQSFQCPEAALVIIFQPSASFPNLALISFPLGRKAIYTSNPSYLQLNMANIPLLESKAVAIALTPGYASRSEWDRVRPIIKRLYFDEGRTLKDVMTIMAQNHGHQAS